MIFRPERDIQNANLLTGIFQGWPSFHDAEILRVTIQRHGGIASAEFVIHVWKTADYRSLLHTLVTLRFDGIELKRFEEFNHQNVMYELTITPGERGDKKFNVELPTSHGCDACLSCDSITVISAEPYTAQQRANDGWV